MKLSYIFLIVAAIVLMLNVADAARGNNGRNGNNGNPNPGRPRSPRPRPSGDPVRNSKRPRTTAAPAVSA